MSDFSFLEPYVCRGYIGPRNRLDENIFYEVSQKEVSEAEQLLGFSFPSELRQFYRKIGCGCLNMPHKPSPDYYAGGGNEILPPLTAARFALGITEWEGQESWISQDFIEDELKPGDLPFFEMYDSSYFMVMKPLSENPNAVWYMGRKKIEDSFETFIRNLYYDDPSYYARDW